MKKKLAKILLASSVVALAALQPVGAEGTKKYKEIHYVTFSNQGVKEIK